MVFWLSDFRSVADWRDTRKWRMISSSFFLLNIAFKQQTLQRDDRATSFRLLLWQCGNHAKDTKREGRKNRGGRPIFADVDVWKTRFLNVGRGGVKERKARVRGFTVVTDWCGGMTLIFSPAASFLDVQTFWWMMNWLHERTDGDEG